MDESIVRQENVMGLLVKFAPVVILKEKNLLKQRKDIKIESYLVNW